MLPSTTPTEYKPRRRKFRKIGKNKLEKGRAGLPSLIYSFTGVFNHVTETYRADDFKEIQVLI